MNAPEPLNLEQYGPHRLTIELVDICNLHCSYCLRDDDALYGHRPNFLSLSLLQHLLPEARAVMGVTRLCFTGGEPSLHPEFAEILRLTSANNLKASFVTNGWNFERIWPAILSARESLTHVAFSIDGVSAADHDRWRGAGSFRRLVGAFTRCYKVALPFGLKVGIRRDTVPKLEQIALFAARMGAESLSFSHILPTRPTAEGEHGLNMSERLIAEQEIASLARIFKMTINLDVGYYNLDTKPPCSPLAGTNCNIDYRGRLTLCCNLSGFRGGAGEEDVVADLNRESFQSAYARLQRLATLQVERRANAIKELQNSNAPKDLYVGSPCLYCLQSFGKIPWRTTGARASDTDCLPVIGQNPAVA